MPYDALRKYDGQAPVHVNRKARRAHPVRRVTLDDAWLSRMLIENDTPERLTRRKEHAERVLSALDPRLRLIVCRALAGEHHGKIGADLGLSQPRVTQLLGNVRLAAETF